MSDNLNPTASPVFDLPQLAVVAFDGPDATRFLQAQTMNDVTGLAVMDWQWNGWLTPQGRLVALFALAKLSGERCLCITPADNAEGLAEGLRKYIFRSKVRIAVAGDLRVAGSLSPPEPGTRVQTTDRETVLRWQGDARSLHLLGPDSPSAHDSTLASHWSALDLAAGIPWTGGANSTRFTPQQLSLERLSAFSVKKGCYPGQEIVARTHFLGKGKRCLFRVVFEDGATVPMDDPAIVSVHDREALCVLSMDPAEHPANMGGARYTVLPFETR